jgi:hypothetical protein
MRDVILSPTLTPLADGTEEMAVRNDPATSFALPPPSAIVEAPGTLQE